MNTSYQRWNNYLKESAFILKIEQMGVLLATLSVRLYQIILSPVIGPACRFYPSCSNYAIEALDRYGLVKGIYLAIRRLLRCHPWNDGGVDPVP